MTMAMRIAVIGAGTAGVGAALRAAQLGAEVTIIDREGPASGSSGRSAAIYNVQTVDPLHIELRVRARELFFELERTRGLPLRKIGNLRVAWTPADLKTLAGVIEVQRGLGLTEDDSVLLDRACIQQLVPDLVTTDLAGGLFGPRDGVIDGAYLTYAVLHAAIDRGARYLKAQVGSYSKRDGRHHIGTDQGDVVADVVINAAGAWAGKVGALMDIDVPVLPQVHDIVKVRLPEALPYTVPMVNTYMPGSAGEALYFRQFDRTTLLAGFHTYEVLEDQPIVDPDGYRQNVQDGYVEAIAAAFAARFPIPGLEVVPGWTGLYPLSPDGEFILGPESADPSIVTCTGLGGVGVTSGSIAGFLASEWAILGAPTTVSGAERWRPARFVTRGARK